VKKPVNFGFLDFSTLEKRKYFCEQEVILNRRLCGDMYIGALPIVRLQDGLKVGGNGEVIEYVVKMKEFPEEAIMSNLLGNGKVDEKIIIEIAHTLFNFHSKAETGGKVDDGGSVGNISFNWQENFDQIKNYIGSVIPETCYIFIKEKIDKFMSNNTSLFRKRIENGRIRDCHGDVHSNNIFILDGKVYIFDCIEFNTRFRYGDVAAEVAFLCMDLDFHGRRDLSDIFTKEYVFRSSDNTLLILLPFYKCYRAYVRGKLACFKSSDQCVSIEEKESAKEAARKYFGLAVEYAKQL
jgi:hypothetical protein